MHKAVTIAIGGALFTIEDAAYKRLDQYLISVRAHFASYEDSDEIISDIEDRIAEEFTGKLNARKKVITLRDTEALIKSMGTVEDFEQFEHAESREKSSDPLARLRRVRLYRDGDDQVIAGVCAGIAKYFGIDPIVVRLLFGLSVFLGGFGVLLYIILWISLPEAKTTAEKIEMTEGHVTLSAIQQRIDKAVPPEKRRGAIRSVIALPVAVIRMAGQVIRKIVRIVVPLLLRLIGIAILIATAFAIAGATFVLLALILNPHSPYIGIPLQDIVGRTGFIILLLSSYFLIFLPLALVLVAGVSLVIRRNLYSFSGTSIFVALWFAALITAGVTAFTLAPSIEAAARQYEAQHLQTVTRTVDAGDFRRIAVGGNTRVHVLRSDERSVTIEATPKDLDRLRIATENDTLTMEYNHAARPCILFCFHQSALLTVRVPAIEEVTLSGASRGDIEGFEGEPLRISTSGGARLSARVSPQALTIDAGGASFLSLEGDADILTATLSGGARLFAEEFNVRTSDIRLSGGTRAFVLVTQELSGSVSGGATLQYRGNPSTVNVTTSGAGTVVPLDVPDEPVLPDMPEQTESL